jgi:hypothetical protein
MNLEKEQLEALSYIGWHEVGATLQITHRAATEHVAIDLQNLRDALVRGCDQSTDSPAATIAQIPRMPESTQLQARHL